MKVVHLAPTYFSPDSVIGGGERYVEELARAQARQGAEVTMVTFGQRRQRFERDGLRYQIYQYLSWRGFSKTNPGCLLHPAALRGADVLHIHQLWTFVSDLGCLFASAIGIPVVGTNHGGGGRWLLSTRLPIFERYARVVGQSRTASELLAKRFGDRVIEIPGGVDTARFCPVQPTQRTRSVLFVGRLRPAKGVHDLVDAFRLWSPDSFRLRIIGRPESEAYLQLLRTKAEGLPIDFETEADDDTVIAAYRAASITVLPSRRPEGAGVKQDPPELMGFTVLESQACGTPVVVSDDGPMRDFVDEGLTGEVFRRGDAADLADKLRRLGERVMATPESVQRACLAVAQRYAWQTVADKHFDLYRQVIAERGGRA